MQNVVRALLVISFVAFLVGVVANVIELATGQRYREYVRRHVFARAGMADSDFYRMDRVVPNVAEGADPIRDENGVITGWKKNIYGFPPVG